MSINKRVTALLLNWKRQDNIKQTISSIREQSVDIEIWLWNNNNQDNNLYDVDYQFNSPKNLICWPRWMMGALCDAECVFTLDDDVKLADANVIYDCISFLDDKPEDTIIGFTGVILDEHLQYFQSKHICSANVDTPVDIVKGRFMFMRKSLLNNVTLENDSSCEDIKISSYSNTKIVPAILNNRFINLKEGDEALFAQPLQHEKRTLAVKKYFKK